MSESTSPLSLRIPDDRRALGLALGIAIGIHLFLLFFVVLPELRPVVVREEPESSPPTITMTIPPPALPERAARPDRTLPQRMVPVPDRLPERPEPVRESASDEIEFAPPEVDAPVILGDPNGPPPAATYESDDVTVLSPQLILESKVEPRFPRLARVARVSGRVIVQAVVDSDGTVRQVEVLECSPSGYGFEQATIDAVSQWRYRPGSRLGLAVSVYVIVDVRFTLQ